MKNLKITFYEDDQIPFKCPECRCYGLYISPIEANKSPDPKCNQDFGSYRWEEEFGLCNFSIKCKTPNCTQVVNSTGSYYYKEFELERENGDLEPVDLFCYKPLVFNPQLDIFDLSSKLPDSLIKELRRSFKLLWLDISSSINAVRTFLERLMDEQGVRKTQPNNRKKNLILHQRIDIFSQKKPEYKDLIMALKIIGNDASHDSKVSLDNLSHCYESIEYLLGEMYEKRITSINKKAKKIVKWNRS